MKIVSFYDVEQYENENRVYSYSTRTMIDYICYSLKSIGIPAEIVSAAETRNNGVKYPCRKTKIEEGIELVQCASKGYKNKFLRELSKIQSRLWLVKYLLKNTEKGETVFFWDAVVLYEPLLIFRLLSKHKKIKILYYCTEIFQYVIEMPEIKKKMEFFLFHDVDKYIFSTCLLKEELNILDKPYAILNGTYKPVTIYNEKFDDDCIHVVYSGIINKTKGSKTAVEMAQFLDERYVLHILGTGSQNDIIELVQHIKENNSRTFGCKVWYEGQLSGESYNKFLQKCKIGLCPQNLETKYNGTSFPSKILSYLSNGLRVVSVDIPAIRTSQVGEILYYVNTDRASDFAKVINRINLIESYDSRGLLSKLDTDFQITLQNLID